MAQNKYSRSERFFHGIPSLLWLTFIWCALWRDFGLASVAMGLILAFFALHLFKLPTLYFSNRFNPWYALTFTAYFIYQIAVASVQVLWLALTFKKPLRNSVVDVQLRTESDLWLTAVAHTLSLIPGSLVVDVDRAHRILYFHVLDSEGDESAQAFRDEAHKIENMILKAVGTKEDLEIVKADEARRREQKAQKQRKKEVAS